jgi:uncharacterized protein YjeT (DUF2065 family)
VARYLLTAMALMFILEGLLPFVAPSLWRSTVQRAALLRDGQLRFFGLTAMMLGLIVLYVVR